MFPPYYPSIAPDYPGWVFPAHKRPFGQGLVAVSLFLLDVREPHESDICRIPGATLIPLGRLEKRIHELDRGWDIVTYCRTGGRSAKAVKFLQEAGFHQAKNLEGGILAWSDQVDPSVAKY